MNFLGVALLVLCFRCAYGLPMVCLLVRMRFLCCFAISNMRVCVVIPKLFSVCCSCFHMLSVCLWSAGVCYDPLRFFESKCAFVSFVYDVRTIHI